MTNDTQNTDSAVQTPIDQTPQLPQPSFTNSPAQEPLPQAQAPQQRQAQPQTPQPAKPKQSLPSRIFDLVLASGGPKTVQAIDPETGKTVLVQQSRATLGQHILAGAIAGLMDGYSKSGSVPVGPGGSRAGQNAAALGGGFQGASDKLQQLNAQPQAQMDQAYARRVAAVKNNIDELRNQQAIDQLHSDDWTAKEKFYQDQKDVFQPVIDTIRESDQASGNGLLVASNLSHEAVMQRPDLTTQGLQAVQDGWQDRTDPQTGRVYHTPTYSLVKIGQINVNRDALTALAATNSGIKEILDRKAGDSVPLSSTMLIGFEKQAHAAQIGYEFIHQMQQGLGVSADKQLTRSEFNDKFRSIPALQRQVADTATALSNVSTQSTAHALAQIQASGKAGEIFKLIGKNPDELQHFIADKENEAIADAAKAKNAGKPMTEAIANAILAEPGETPERKQIAQAFLDSQTKQAARKSGAEAGARVSAENAGKAAAEAPEIEAVAQSLAKGDLASLKDITSMRGDQRAKVYTRAKQINPNFNTKDVDLKVKTQDAFTTGKQGDQIQSFGTFLEHAGDAAQASAVYRRTGSPLINRPLNWIAKNAANDATYQTYLTSLQAPVEEYMTFLQNNHALTESDKKAGDRILNGELSPAQIEASLKQIAKTAFFRLDELNSRYRRVMNVDFPDLLSDEARNSANVLGMGQAAAKYQTGGRMTGGAGGVVPGTKTPVQAPPVSLLKEGVNTTFKNGQVWTLQNGTQVQVK